MFGNLLTYRLYFVNSKKQLFNKLVKFASLLNFSHLCSPPWSDHCEVFPLSGNTEQFPSAEVRLQSGRAIPCQHTAAQQCGPVRCLSCFLTAHMLSMYLWSNPCGGERGAGQGGNMMDSLACQMEGGAEEM